LLAKLRSLYACHGETTVVAAADAVAADVAAAAAMTALSSPQEPDSWTLRRTHSDEDHDEKPDAKAVRQDIVDTLVDMGYSAHAATKAAMNNSQVESAVEWCMAHTEDADFNEPMEGSPQPIAVLSPVPSAADVPELAVPPALAAPKESLLLSQDAAYLRKRAETGYTSRGSVAEAIADAEDALSATFARLVVYKQLLDGFELGSCAANGIIGALRPLFRSTNLDQRICTSATILTRAGLSKALTNWLATAGPGTRGDVMSEMVHLLKPEQKSKALSPAAPPGAPPPSC